MDYELVKQYTIERLKQYVEELDDISDNQILEEHRLMFRFGGRPIELAVWVNEDVEMVCVTSRTAELPIADFGKAVQFLKSSLETCWEFCTAVSSVETHYDLSMPIFLPGLNQETFRSVIYNLMNCAEAIEENYALKIEGRQPEKADGEEGAADAPKSAL